MCYNKDVELACDKYIKPLDGLRVIALLGVFAYHLFSNLVPSGYLGVVIFFVLAGFLSMQAIVKRDDENVTIADAKGKIVAKILKLLPALLMVVLCVSIIMTIYFKNFLKSFPTESISSIFFFNNIVQIFNNESYFDAMNSIKPLTHLWALSLEMQFYLVFFITLYITYKKENSGKILFVLFLLYFISQSISIYLFLNGINLTRIYYGFDTRLNAFIVGIFFSILTMKSKSIVDMVQNLRFIELPLLIIMIAYMFVPLKTDISIIISLTVYSILSAVLIFALTFEHIYIVEKSITYKILSNKFFDFFVKRSYVIYLVHYPVIVLATRFLAHTKVNYYIYTIALIPLILIISELIYKLSKKANLIVILLLLVAAFGISIYDTKYDKYEEVQYELDEEIDDDIIEETKDNVTENKNTYSSKDVKEYEDNYKITRAFKYIDRVNDEIGGDILLSHDDFEKYHNLKISLVGDSIAECAKNALDIYFPDSYIDAVPNRQWNKGYMAFTELKKKNGAVGDVVVFSLGTNSDRDINIEDIEKAYYAANGKPVVLLSIVSPLLQEEKKRNDVLRKFVATHKNCFLADWYYIMKTHNECFMNDNTHPKGTGSLAFAQLIFKTAITAYENKDILVTDETRFSYLSNKNLYDIVEFGSYFVDEENKKPIEWFVISKDEDIHSMLLLSKYAIDCRKYNDTYNTISFAKSSLRKWLNEYFYEEAFDEETKEYIREKETKYEKNPIYNSEISISSKDKVIIPSYNEVIKYLNVDIMKCKASPYAKYKGVYEDPENDMCCDWWLRNTGDKSCNIMYVGSDGEIVYEGDYCITDDFGIRPAIYIRYD